MSLTARTGLTLVLSLGVLSGCSGEVAAPEALTTPTAPACGTITRSAPPSASARMYSGKCRS